MENREGEEDTPIEQPNEDIADFQLSLYSSEGSLIPRAVERSLYLNEGNENFIDPIAEDINLNIQDEFLSSTKQLNLIVLASLSVAVSILFQFLVFSITLHFIGKDQNTLHFDAFGFAFLLTTCGGGFLIFGYNQGLGMYIGRAFGKQETQIMHLIFTQGLMIFIAGFLLYMASIHNYEIIIKFFDDDDELARLTQLYSVQIIFGLFFNYLADLYRNYLNGQRQYIGSMVIQIISIFIHYFLTERSYKSHGIDGAIYSLNFTLLITFIGVFLFAWFKDLHPQITTKKVFTNFNNYFYETSNIAWSIFSDQVYNAIAGIMIGAFHDYKYLGGHIALSNFLGIVHSLPAGIGGAVTYLISNSLGAGDIKQTKILSAISYITSFVSGIILFLSLSLYGENIADWYSEDKQIYEGFLALSDIYLYGVIFDCIQLVLAGITRGSGKATETLYITLFGYFVIGIGLGYYLAFIQGYGAPGIWYGFIVAIYAVFILLNIVLYYIDFSKQTQVIHDNMMSSSVQRWNRQKED